MKKTLTIFLLTSVLNTNAQVGVNTRETPSTLNINGSFAVEKKDISSNYTLTEDDFYIIYNNTVATSANHVITLPNIPTNSLEKFKGRMYHIKNASKFPVDLMPNNYAQTLRVGNSIGVSNFTIPAGSYVEIVHTGSNTTNAWDVMYLSNSSINQQSNVKVYSTQLAIPPMNVNGGLVDWATENTTANIYNTANKYTDINGFEWKVISKTSISHSRETRDYYVMILLVLVNYPFMVGYVTSSMEITYEYQGPSFQNLDKIYPILTTGNNTNTYPDVFVPSFFSISNDTGKTRLKVKVSRVDKIAYQQETTSGTYSNLQNSNWVGNFIMNLVLAEKI